jgi:hypothetical protein
MRAALLAAVLPFESSAVDEQGEIRCPNFVDASAHASA